MWLRFESAYQYLVRINTDPDVLINCLNRALRGEPLHLVEHLLILRLDPSEIMDELRGFYGDAKKNIARLTRAVLSSPTISGPNDSNLRELAIKIKRLVTTIHNCAYHSELDSVYTQNTILQKLTDDQVDKWYEQVKRRPESNLEDLAEFLMERARRSTMRQPDPRPLKMTAGSKGAKRNVPLRPVHLHNFED